MSAGDAANIPEKFFGRFVVEKSENFDEFLVSKGVNWILRKMIQFTSVTKVIAKNEAEGKYNFENLSRKKNTAHLGWTLGETFEDEGLDGKRHKITFEMKDDALAETRIRLDDANDKGETYFYTIDDENKLVLKMENNGIVCRRWFKREEPKQ